MSVTIVGCRYVSDSRTTVTEYITRPSADAKADARAKKLNSRGVTHFRNGNLAKAEAMFREALESDVGYAPAHNNLGQIYLARHQLYLAAWEFEYCSRLLPDRLEPVVNQGLSYEMAGRLDQAESLYRLAYSMDGSSGLAIGALARVLVKQDGDAHEIHQLLDDLVFHDSRESWVEWAKLLRETKYKSCDCEGCDLLSEVTLEESATSEETDPDWLQNDEDFGLSVLDTPESVLDLPTERSTQPTLDAPVVVPPAEVENLLPEPQEPSRSPSLLFPASEPDLGLDLPPYVRPKWNRFVPDQFDSFQIRQAGFQDPSSVDSTPSTVTSVGAEIVQ